MDNSVNENYLNFIMFFFSDISMTAMSNRIFPCVCNQLKVYGLLGQNLEPNEGYCKIICQNNVLIWGIEFVYPQYMYLHGYCKGRCTCPVLDNCYTRF